MAVKLILITTLILEVNGWVKLDVNNKFPALDKSLYEDVLDAEQCNEQIEFIRNSTALFLQFADAGIRTPRGFLTGNFVDMGNYHQCLGITHNIEEMQIQGKYCTIAVPLNQDLTFLSDTNWPEFDTSFFKVSEEVISKVDAYNWQRAQMLASVGIMDENLVRSIPSLLDSSTKFTLAVCVPKPCTTRQAIASFFNVSDIGFQYEDNFCRLPNDKPWSPADSVAVVIFILIGLLTLLCTIYDLIHTFVLKKDAKQSSRLLTSFSVYTNGRRLMNFSSSPSTLHCLDGIRTWAMAWVVVGHTFSTEIFTANPIDSGTWMPTLAALWITAAPITVDTFFCLAGILLVYTSVGKMNGAQLLKNLHLFYLNRLLRMFPLLAAAVLLQASFINRMWDGPYWRSVENQTNNCRSNWWATLLHVQNYIGPLNMCVPHSWYIAIDVQLYIISPLVLFWVLGRQRWVAWTALIGGLLVSLIVASVYNFINDFQSGTVALNRMATLMNYMVYYYYNTFTRASPFFVGMICGYLLHVCRGKKLDMSWLSVTFFWVCAASVSTTIFFYPYFIKQRDWDNQVVDNVMNSFMRPAWGASLCWMVFACTHGYGGPVNWFLTLNIWKLPARVSYAIFIFHYPIMFAIKGSTLAPTYFSAARLTFQFLAHMFLSLVVAYFATLLIDSPFSTLSKILLDGNKKKPVQPKMENKKHDYKEIETSKDVEINKEKIVEENDRSANKNGQLINTSDNTDEFHTRSSVNGLEGFISENDLSQNQNGENTSEKNREIVKGIDVAFEPITISK